jgi:hypothetical protein
MPDEPDEAVAARLRRNWFFSVHEISDIGLQRRKWLDPENSNPHWSYVEFVESYPTSAQLRDALAHGRLSGDEFAVLSDLGQKLSQHFAPKGDDYDNAAVLGDPAWHAVVAFAQRAKQELLLTITDESERRVLLIGG